MHCSYCKQPVADEDDYLECVECEYLVHAKCLRTCRPGDLLGDIFFDFTCADCMNLQYNAPSTSSSAKAAVPRENFVRQRMSWFMIVALALYNLSVKSKGLSHHGFFHWRSHIVSFINKNWDFLMEPGTRRRKNWFGSISGNLSHYSPDFFLSGQETIQKLGWWRLAQTNLTPKMIHRKYEEFSQKRAQMRSDKRGQEDADNSDEEQHESKRRRQIYSDDEIPPITDGCSRTMPYMGRTPKVAKQLDIVDDDIKNFHQQQPLNTVQSSLMDFLAENLANDDFFSTLPNSATETLVGGDDKNGFLPLLETQNDNVGLFDTSEAKYNPNSAVYESNTVYPVADKLKSFYDSEQHGDQKTSSVLSIEQFPQEDSMQTSSEDSNDDDDEYQPRIIQVTNFQELNQSPKKDKAGSIEETLLHKFGQEIKKEVKSDAEQSEAEDKHSTKKDENYGHTAGATQPESENEGEGVASILGACKPSLFTKVPRRNWPWLVEESDEAEEEAKMKPFEQNESLIPISEYEEIELLHKLRKIFSMEEQCKIQIPAFIRRFYRKLCVREWKREHGKPLFNLDDHINGKCNVSHDAKSKIIDRYQQLISLSSESKRKSFYARIAGSFDYEMFESPYSHRILHPFIYRDKEIAPPWLKLMCELQFKVNGEYPFRSPIDFCYVRPNHIAAVNALLQTSFWPGIDMSECLSYPDYSVVALYKKLVVGCGFLVPDVGFNEAYISFMAVRPNWQRCGIGTFMLYHLIQWCCTRNSASK
ncbi:PREDICTED: cysteine-rich protein 2-binding protein isoform X2 [Rhagoletis zephyria]|uniref:cysteine-rich protein 2-binding protein isoform X2 n=1 Tax=Rhagoletis zephyria TaxID=28612 RepID=UPI0008115801|nr:PREDICTED: cysteine-rich protein 2-binding protein isoform X2 [Rhagoletis zephyria]